MSLDTPRDLLVQELKNLYSAETQFAATLPVLARRAGNGPLRQALIRHLAETEERIGRLEATFEALAGSPKGMHCAGMQGMVEESRELLAETGAPAVLDLALIDRTRRIVLYQIAAYQSAHDIAMLLGLEPIAELLGRSLLEQESMAERLTAIGRHQVSLRDLSTDVEPGDAARMTPN